MFSGENVSDILDDFEKQIKEDLDILDEEVGDQEM